MASSSSESDYRLLLIGRTGDGKSSTGNTILGANVFEVAGTSESVTATCKWSEKYSRLDKIVEVVDTPGFFDTKLDDNTVFKQLLMALALTVPGFHAIAFVLRRGTKFTEEVQKTKELFFQWFGPGVEKFACLILTDTDSNEEMEEYMTKSRHKVLSDLVQGCKGNVIPINNKASKRIKDLQVKQLFDVLENIKQKNSYKHFSNFGFHLTDEYIKYKYPKELTEDSVKLLEKLKGNEEECKNYDRILSAVEEETTHEEPCDDNLEAEFRGKGNLTIIDNETNERIPNAAMRNIPNMQCKQTCSYQTFDETSSVSGRRVTSKGKQVHQDGNIVNSSDCERQTEFSKTDQATGFNTQEKKSKVKLSTRKGRHIDVESVTYEIPTRREEEIPTRREEFKRLINNDEDGEHLHGLRRYFLAAWGWCKERASRCTLL